MVKEIHVLRLGHRPHRDLRLTTHVGLLARAFGAKSMIIGDVNDTGVSNSINSVNDIWGGDFEVKSAVASRELLKKWRKEGGLSMHLTMYGEKWSEELIHHIREEVRNILVIVGSQKVSGEIYQLVDRNISIGNQPHSEAAALSIFLYEILGKEKLYRNFPGACQRITPSARGKNVLNLANE